MNALHVIDLQCLADAQGAGQGLSCSVWCCPSSCGEECEILFFLFHFSLSNTFFSKVEFVLGVDTSCDDTSVALVTPSGEIVLNHVSSQVCGKASKPSSIIFMPDMFSMLNFSSSCCSWRTGRAHAAIWRSEPDRCCEGAFLSAPTDDHRRCAKGGCAWWENYSHRHHRGTRSLPVPVGRYTSFFSLPIPFLSTSWM